MAVEKAGRGNRLAMVTRDQREESSIHARGLSQLLIFFASPFLLGPSSQSHLELSSPRRETRPCVRAQPLGLRQQELGEASGGCLGLPIVLCEGLEL